MSGGLRRWLAPIIGVVAVAVAVVVLVRDADAVAALRSLPLGAVALLMATQSVNVVSDSVRYQMVVPARYRPGIGWMRWHNIFAVGRLLNLVIPQAGMAYRAARLRLEHDMPVSSFVGSVAAISWLGNGIALVVTGVVVVATGEPWAGAAVSGAGLGILALVGVLPRWAPRRPSRSILPERMAGMLSRAGEAFVELASTPGRLLRVLSVSLITQLAGLAGFLIVCSAMEVERPLLVAAVLYTSATIVTVVSLTPGGLGITELAAAVAGGSIGVGAGLGVAVALVIRATGIAAVAGFALVTAVGGRGSAPSPTTPVDR
jgi:uncharacterized membrane protein YbhN (UPF0104 family)